MIQKNAVVLYKNQCAVVTDIDGDKYVIQYCTVPASASGKKAQYASLKVREKDIVLLHKGPAGQLDALLSFEDGSIPQQIAEVHELLRSDESSASASAGLGDIAELMRGTFKVEECYALYKAFTGCFEFSADDTAFKSGKIAFIPRQEEEIALLRQKADEKEHAGEIRDAFIKRLRQRKLELPGDAKFMVEVEALALGKTDKSKVLADAGVAQTPEKAHKLLLDTGIWTILRNPYPSRYGLTMVSASEGLQSPPEEERLKIEGTAYAIDNAWSADPDDAVAWDGTYLWVHIADPAAAVMPDSSIDKSARERGTTLYLPEGTSRMLAETALADYALGLNEISRALSFRIRFDEKGAVDDCSVFKTLVDVKRLTYEKATELKDTPELKPLFDIAERNFGRRTKAGAKSINLPEVHITVNQETKQVSIEPEVHYKAADMVCEMMLLAGEGAARFAFKNHIPFPYVSQEPPEIPADIPAGLAGEFRMLRCMHKRSVGIVPAPHAAIGVAMYSQVTSPLRRYSDLVAHEQLRAFIDGRQLVDKDAMLERISEGDAASVAAKKASRYSETHWKLVYLLQHPDWSGEAVCVDRREKQIQLYIPSLDMQTYIVPKKIPALNEVMTVKAADIDIPTQNVVFMQL
ncbi:MAG: RNB domain-containing ribonuclease [Treponema sp.]|nr:RNB domain-containing ribonuclease [Treponema sp.]